MTDRQSFVLVNNRVRDNALAAVRNASGGCRITIAPPQRSADQNSKFHALCSDLSKSQVRWFGKRRSDAEWKALMISAHAVATDNKGEVIPGIEGEMVAIRESSANMTVARASSLIEYTQAYCVSNGVELLDTEAGGWLDEAAA